VADGSVRRDHLFKVAWVVAGLVFAPSRAEAYRPFDGTDADVAEVGVFELELGPVQYYRLGPQNYLVAPDLVLRRALTLSRRGWG
jgi:hypothetical protein